MTTTEDAARLLGSAGGKASAAVLTATERSERARRAGIARWRKQRAFEADVAAIDAELDALPSCSRCGGPCTPAHDRDCRRGPVTIDTLVASMPDGVE